MGTAEEAQKWVKVTLLQIPGLNGELDSRDERGMAFVAHAKAAQLAQLFATDDEPRRHLR